MAPVMEWLGVAALPVLSLLAVSVYFLVNRSLSGYDRDAERDQMRRDRRKTDS